jgi:hypothetical protein
MIPSIDTRLASMASAVSGVIGPALGTTNPFASEQATLLVGHLQVMRVQQGAAEEFEHLDYNRTRAFARELADAAEGGAAVQAAATAVRLTLDAPVPFTITQVRAAQDVIAAAIGGLVTAAGEDGTDAYVATSSAIVTRQERAQSIRFRSYFAVMGYEDGSRPIPPMEQMMDEFRAEYGAPAGAAS